MKTKSDAVLSAKSLRYFLQLIDSMSYTQASQILGITQPALTQQIKKIERAVGAPLFGQIGKKLYLTDAGLKMEETAKKLFDTVAGAIDQIQKDTNSESGNISIGMLSSIEYAVVEDFIVEFNQQFPDVTISLNMLTRNEIWERLESNQIDLAIMQLPDESIKNWKPYETKKIYDDEILFLTHDKLGAKKSISLKDSTKNKWVMYPTEYYVPQLMIQAYKNARIDIPNVVIRFTSPYQVIRFAQETDYDTVVTRSFYWSHVDQINMNVVPFSPALKFEVSFIYRNEKVKIPRIQNFLNRWDEFLYDKSYEDRLKSTKTF